MARSPFSLRAQATDDVDFEDGVESDTNPIQETQHSVEVLDEDNQAMVLVATQDPPRDPSGRIVIDVHGRSFDSIVAMKKLRSIIHSHYTGDWITFSEIPKTVKDLWFAEFRRTYAWDEAKYEAIKAVWKLKASDHLRNVFRKARDSKRKIDWINQQDWESMCKKWKTCKRFQKRSTTNKKNRAVESLHGSASYTRGSVSVAEHMRRFVKKNKRKPSMEELMAITYQKKSGDWSGTRPEKTMVQFKELLAAAEKDGNELNERDVIALWVKAAGGVNKGYVFGLGSQVSDVPQELLEKYSFANGQSSSSLLHGCTEELKENQAVIQDKVYNMEAKMESMAGAVETLTAQLSSILSYQPMASHPAPFIQGSTQVQSFSQSMQAAMQPTASLTNDMNMYSNLLNSNIGGGTNRLMFQPMGHGFDPFFQHSVSTPSGIENGQTTRRHEAEVQGSKEK